MTPRGQSGHLLTPRKLATRIVIRDAIIERPRTHCGSLHRPPLSPADQPRRNSVRAEEEEGDEDVPLIGGSRGADALDAVSPGCRSCCKLRLRVEHERRARVKAQEQLVQLQAEVLRLRSRWGSSGNDAVDTAIPAPGGNSCLEGIGHCGKDSEDTVIPTPGGNSCPEGIYQGEASLLRESLDTAMAAAGGNSRLEGIGRSLDGYQREVSFLRESLHERDEREAAFAESQRRLRGELESAKQELEAQVATLICDVQELEAQNRKLMESSRGLSSYAAALASAELQ